MTTPEQVEKVQEDLIVAINGITGVVTDLRYEITTISEQVGDKYVIEVENIDEDDNDNFGAKVYITIERRK